jgi:hypothetical protein
MKPTHFSRFFAFFSLALALLLAGCYAGQGLHEDPPTNPTKPADTKPADTKPVPEPPHADIPPKPAGNVKRAQLGQNVWIETEGDKRRIVVNAEVCLREGQYGLECLLCRQGTKEHESILAMDADARIIHAGLMAAGAKPGSPVKFDPKFVPASGPTIKVTLRYEQKGKTVSVPAQQWVRNSKTKKDLEYDWVFAGSIFYKNPLDPEAPEAYAAAGEGAAICVTDVPTAMLALPIGSTNNPDLGRAYEPNTDRIPAVGSKIEVILEPVPEKK